MVMFPGSAWILNRSASTPAGRMTFKSALEQAFLDHAHLTRQRGRLWPLFHSPTGGSRRGGAYGELAPVICSGRRFHPAARRQRALRPRQVPPGGYVLLPRRQSQLPPAATRLHLAASTPGRPGMPLVEAVGACSRCRSARRRSRWGPGGSLPASRSAEAARGPLLRASPRAPAATRRDPRPAWR